MCITNEPSMAKIADESGVDYIFLDLELLGKEERQGHLDTVISKHKIEDLKRIKPHLKKSKLLVRINPVHRFTKKEIETSIEYGADTIMLPYFKSKDEVEFFLNTVDGRAETILLLETKEAFDNIDEILELKDKIDAVHIGLNDLHLSYDMSFMFELFISGHVTTLVDKFKINNIKFGIGGVAELGKGDIPAELVLNEHYKLGSSMCILSRSFSQTLSSDSKSSHANYKDKVADLRFFWDSIEPSQSHDDSLLFSQLIKERIS